MDRVKGKVAIVTGAAKGLGEATGCLLAQEGACLVVTDLDAAGGQVARGIAAAGGRALFIRQDVTSETDWVETIAATVEAFGSLSILVNNAGIAFPGTVEDTTLEAWRKLMAVNLDAVFLGTRHAIGAMRAAGGGSHECYDVGHLYNLAHCLDQGWFEPPIFLQFIFGILVGIGADKLFGMHYHWPVLAAGRHQMPFATQAAMFGGNVRVGLEDSLFIGRGKLARSNAEQVRTIRTILNELRYEIASPQEACDVLQLKGSDLVNF